MRIRRLVAVAALALAGAVAGCGGGGDGGDRLTKEEYIAKADAICKEINDQMDALGEPENFEDIVELAAKAIELQEGGLDRLRALKPPAEDEATLNEAFDLIEQQTEIGRQIKDAAEAGDLQKIQDLLEQGEPLNEKADQIASDYGLTECGNS